MQSTGIINYLSIKLLSGSLVIVCLIQCIVINGLYSTMLLPQCCIVSCCCCHIFLIFIKILYAGQVKTRIPSSIWLCLDMAAFHQLSTHGLKFDPESLYEPM